MADLAALAKIIANGLPVWFLKGFRGAVLIGVSMVPRAEIAMVIMSKGLSLGDWIVPSQVFSAMVLVTIITCIASPLAVQRLLKKWPQKEETS